MSTLQHLGEVNFQKQGPVFKRIPKASRVQSCKIFKCLLDKVIENNDKYFWEKLFNFARCGIGSSVRGGKKNKTQATVINNRLTAFMNGTSHTANSVPRKVNNNKQSSLKHRVSAKMALGDIKGQ